MSLNCNVSLNGFHTKVIYFHNIFVSSKILSIILTIKISTDNINKNYDNNKY